MAEGTLEPTLPLASEELGAAGGGERMSPISPPSSELDPNDYAPAQEHTFSDVETVCSSGYGETPFPTPSNDSVIVVEFTTTADVPVQPTPAAPTTGHESSNINSGHGSMEASGANTPLVDLSAASSTQVRPGGAPARVYLNEKIVPHLLEGMKSVAREQPSNPLKVLGEFLLQKSEEVERDSKKESE
ncbi:hypothetical protein N7532_006311 [Penicillium argentinense]|uniref:Uncharacterized protein n=1 Tax=Penicillium argentinense TaxID=1131581 RepID=A0A9W9FFU7_9EURO|nr:uncharacterized protein N7532_006311 [Penicillium argentinense]KAJ5099310.1 hypothetical protein N7532_006311 [Penicillium argentinense]